MNYISITFTFLSFIQFSLCIWNYGYSANSGTALTVIKPTFTGVQPSYVIMKPSYSALRAGLSVFKPNYNGMKPEYRPDSTLKPSYSGLRVGLNPTYLSHRQDKHLKPKPIKKKNDIIALVIKQHLQENFKTYSKKFASNHQVALPD